MRLQIEIPLQVTIDIRNKKIPIQELTSALKGLEAVILGRVLEEIDCLLISLMQKGYGKKMNAKHQKEKRTIVTQVGKTTFSVTRVKEKSTGRTFAPLYNLIEFDGRRLYQPDIAAIAIDYALSMSYRDSRQRLERITESPSHSTIWRRVQELGRSESEFEYDSFVSADGTKLHAQGRGKLEVRIVAGESVIVGVNERYEEMKEKHEIKATVVGDADRDLSCFEECNLLKPNDLASLNTSSITDLTALNSFHLLSKFKSLDFNALNLRFSSSKLLESKMLKG